MGLSFHLTFVCKRPSQEIREEEERVWVFILLTLSRTLCGSSCISLLKFIVPVTWSLFCGYSSIVSKNSSLLVIQKIYPGLVLIRYGKTHGHKNNYHERSLYSQIRRNRRHCIPHRAAWGKEQGRPAGREEGGQSMAQNLYWGFHRKV